ncbi:MAG TPA: Lrp/AsnC family transcriptional regulator [Methylomirabilota bacterium]|jgi:Lrp/AsnC family leucine-responsive transcriptional regulator|nr:Lrp/AsnC family transcriptional regulator [Methylomirabilota bacterium]
MAIALDSIDRHILAVLQEDCKLSLTKIGERVGLSAPSVTERIKKLEESGVIRGYTAILDARKLGKDITAFIGVFIDHPKLIAQFEKDIAHIEDVQECHHVTGEYTLLLKIKTENTSTLEALIRKIRSINGVARTETSIVLRTATEGLWLNLKETPEEAVVEPDVGRRGHEEAQVLKLKRGG